MLNIIVFTDYSITAPFFGLLSSVLLPLQSINARIALKMLVEPGLDQNGQRHFANPHQ